MSRLPHIPLHVQAAVFAQADGTAYAQALADSMAVDNPIRDTSGQRPKYIMPEYVLYSYPADRQYNVYSKEHGDDYLLVEYDYSYLFTTEKPAGYDQKVRLKNFSGTTQAAPFRYTTSPATTDSRVQFELSVSLKDFTFKADEIYSMSVVNIPKTTVSKLDANIVAKTHKVDSTTSDVDVITHSAEGDMEILDQTNIYSAHFRTSSYGTFVEKMDGFSIGGYVSTQINGTLFKMYVTNVDKTVVPELFDDMEYSFSDAKDLIKVVPDYSNTDWYLKEIAPLIYDNKEAQNLCGNKNPPTGKDVIIMDFYERNKSLTENDIAIGSVTAKGNKMLFINNEPEKINTYF